MNTINKKILTSIAFLVSVFAILMGCEDDDSFKNVSVTPVNQFYEPVNNRYAILQSSGSMYFEWEKATAQDNSIVYYDVLFDKEDGDFSNPISVVTSDNKGISTGATITHKTLNKIAARAGIELAEEGTLKWTVRSSRGLNFSLAEEVRTMTLV